MSAKHVLILFFVVTIPFALIAYPHNSKQVFVNHWGERFPSEHGKYLVYYDQLMDEANEH